MIIIIWDQIDNLLNSLLYGGTRSAHRTSCTKVKHCYVSIRVFRLAIIDVDKKSYVMAVASSTFVLVDNVFLRQCADLNRLHLKYTNSVRYRTVIKIENICFETLDDNETKTYRKHKNQQDSETHLSSGTKYQISWTMTIRTRNWPSKFTFIVFWGKKSCSILQSKIISSREDTAFLVMISLAMMVSGTRLS